MASGERAFPSPGDVVLPAGFATPAPPLPPPPVFLLAARTGTVKVRPQGTRGKLFILVPYGNPRRALTLDIERISLRRSRAALILKPHPHTCPYIPVVPPLSVRNRTRSAEGSYPSNISHILIPACNPMSDAPFITKADIQALKDYVKGPSSAAQAESTVLIHCTHSNLKARFFEIRLDRHVSNLRWAC